MKMKIQMFPARNLGCIGLYARSWAVDFTRSPRPKLYVRLGMRTLRVDFARTLALAWRILLPPAAVAAIWALAVVLMGLR